MTGTTRDDRGQLILVGAVALSLVLIGIVVVFSTTLFTANMAASSTNAGISDGSALESDVNQTVSELIDAHDQGNVSDFDDEIKNYSSIISDRYADSGPTIVTVECMKITNSSGTDINCENVDGSTNIATVDIALTYETRATTIERRIKVDANP